MEKEYLRYNREYSNISFNDTPANRNKNKYLFALETFCIHPSNYNENIISQYKGYITWNKKIYDKYKNIYNCYYYDWFPRFEDFNWLENFINFEDKINGVSLICRHRNGNLEGDISGRRLKTLEEISFMKKIITHCYGKQKYGGELYQGVIGNTHLETCPSSLSKLKILNKYKFNLCFENCYHELWSWDYITEKITDCFKAKTIPIYYGCYNIEKHIPKKLYIDFRDFKNLNDLVDYLLSIDKKKYEEMTNEALNFMKNLTKGTTKELKKLFDNL